MEVDVSVELALDVTDEKSMHQAMKRTSWRQNINRMLASIRTIVTSCIVERRSTRISRLRTCGRRLRGDSAD